MAPTPLSLDPHAGSTPLANQVAGHQNVMSDASGSLVIKPALPREIAFYHLLNSASRSAPVYKLKPLVPQFFGTLRLEGRVDGEGGITAEGLKPDEVPESVVLENLSHLYTHPSIMDVKLGTVLAGPDATPEKQARMEAQAKGSTSWEMGIRLTGCQTWHAPSQSYILTPKSYGKKITAAQLPEGLIRFFPLPSDMIQSIVTPPTPPASSSASTPVTSTPISHLPLPSSDNASTSDSIALAPPTPVTGSTDSTDSNTTGGSTTSPSQYTAHAIPPRTLLRVLALVDHNLSGLEVVLSRLEARFIGASILIVYEGEPARLESALDRWEAKRAREALIAAAAPPDRQDDIDEDEDEDDYDEIDDEDSSTSSDDDEDDGAAADARRARRCPPVTLKMIDFAHTRLVEGEGPDEGVLKGVRTLRSLVQGRAETVRREVYKQGQAASAES